MRENTCVICGKTFPCRTAATKTCSKSCKKAFLAYQAESKYTSRVEGDFGTWLYDKYVHQLWSYKDIMAHLGMSNVRMLMRLMRKHNIPVRGPSEAVAAQYIRNPERRDMARNIFLALGLPPKPGEPNVAQNPEVGKRISQAKKGHRMYRRKAWKRKVCQSFQRLAQERPETEIEAIMRNALIGAGIPFAQQLAVDCYVIDFAIEYQGRKIAVECDGAHWHSQIDRAARDQRRDAELSELGWLVLRFPDSFILEDPERCVNIVKAALY